jgi:hypothetical protein
MKLGGLVCGVGATVVTSRIAESGWLEIGGLVENLRFCVAAGLTAIVLLLASAMREMVEAIVHIMAVIWVISPWSVAKVVEEVD